MLAAAALPAALAAIPAVEYRKVLYRTIRPQFLAALPPNPLPTPLSGIGASLRGARYTPKGTFDTIYLAEDAHTAYIEFHNEMLALMRDMDDEQGVRLPTLATLAPHAAFVPSGILDLTRRDVRQHLNTDLNELALPWRTVVQPALSPTQLLAREVHATGRYLGIRYFSLRNPGGVCLAIFEDLLALRAKGGPDSLDLDGSAAGGPVQSIP